MKKPVIQSTILILFFFGFYSFLNAQSKTIGDIKETKLRSIKPYKVLTNSRQITIQSKQLIRNIMVWTVSGHRIAEAKNINEPSFSFTIFVNEKIFFLLLEFVDGKKFTEKIGIR
jgi:hypothetical protein